MLIALLILWSSVLVGYLTRRWPQRWVGQVLPISIWLMLFVIGIEVGSNEVLVGSLGKLGAESLLLTVLTTVCCGIGSLVLLRSTQPAGDKSRPIVDASTASRISLRKLWASIYDSVIIFACFVGGCVLGYLGADAYLPASASFYALCLLLVCVGLGVGQNEELLKHFRHIKRSYILLPVITVIATWIGALTTFLLLPHRSLPDWLAVSSGFGYYSLSSILISEARGVELGTVALMYNVLREITVLIFAPLLLRLFGPLAPISVGGATTADTTLPTISRISGTQYIPVAIFHGLVVDLSVPLLVPLFCML